MKNITRGSLSLALGTLAVGAFLLSASFASAATWYVDAAAAPDGDGLTPGSATTTIQAAINAASNSDTVEVAAGTYNENVAINKTLTLLGAQAGVDARTRGVVSESVIQGTSPVAIMANGVVLDGFTVQGSDSSGFIAGVWYNPSFSGTNGGFQIINNIIQNNVMGIGVGNDGTFPAVVQYNLVQNNTNVGPGSGVGFSAAFASDDILVSDNVFDGNQVYLNGAEFSGVVTDVTVSNNEIMNVTGSGLYLLSVTEITVSGNDIHDNTGNGISVSGNVSNTSVTGNTIDSNGGRGINVSDPWAAGVNSTVVINSNVIEGNALEELNVVAATHTGTLDATLNYWGAFDSATVSASVAGDVDYTPWYVDSALTIQSDANSITSFDLTSPASTGVVDNTGHTVTLTVPNGTDVTSLTPTIVTVLGSTISPLSGVAQNFSSNPVVYTVTSADGTVVQPYNVSVLQGQTITVATLAPASAVYGSTFDVDASSDSGLGVAITVTGGCSGGGTDSATITMMSGTTACVVHYNQGGNSSFAPATEITENVTAAKAELTVTGITADNKVYDATIDATISTTSAALVGAVLGDVITPDFNPAVGVFADKHVGAGKTVTISGITTDANTDNYFLTQPTDTADITQAVLSVTATGINKEYDGNTSATVNFNDDRIGGDIFTVSGTATFDTPNVGTGKTVDVTGISLAGADAGNYSHNTTTSTTADIVDTTAPVTSSALITSDPINVANETNVVVTFTATDLAGVVVVLPTLDDGVTTILPTSISTTTATTYSATFDTTLLADGTITLNVTAKDAVGNMSNTSTDTVQKDATAPVVDEVSFHITNGTLNIGDILIVTIDADQTGYTAGTITVNGESVTGFTDNGDTTYEVLYTVASGDDDVADNEQIPVSVELIDAFLNSTTFTTSPLAGLTPTIDANAPATPAAPDLDAASDSNISTDNITSDSTPTFSGTAEVGSTVRLYADGVQVGSQVAGGGTWNITATSLSDATYAIEVTATDAALNTSATSSALSLTIDTAAPAAPSTPDLDAASDTGDSNSDDLTKDDTPTFTGTAEAGTTVTIYSGITSVGSAVAGGGNYSVTASALSEGSQGIAAVATDVAGNTGSASGSLGIQVDVTAPGLSETTPVAEYTNNTTPAYGFTANEAGTISYPGACTSAQTVGASGVNNITFSALAQATYNSCTIVVTDAAGNASTPLAVGTFTVDTTAPVASLISVADPINLSNQTSVTVTFTITDTNNVMVVFPTLFDGATTITPSSISTTTAVAPTFTFTATFDASSLSDTTITADVTANDYAGNVGASGGTDTATKDTVRPTVTAVDSDGDLYNEATVSPVTIMVTFSENMSTAPDIEVDGDAQTENNCSDADAKTFCFDYTVPGNTDLTTMDISIENAQDANGNAMLGDASHDFEVDTKSPVASNVVSDDPINAANVTNVTVTFDITDDAGVDDVFATLTDGITLVSASSIISLGGDSYEATFDASTLVDGTDALVASVSGNDFSGNAGATSTDSMIDKDTEAPVITVLGSNPDSLFATTIPYADAGATATDNIDTSVAVGTAGTVNSSTAGTYTLTYTATDTAGNSTSTTRTVTVNQHGGGGTSGGGGGGGGGGAPVGSGPSAPSTPSAPTGQVLGASTFNFSSNFGIGSSGEQVTELQKILIAGGYLKIATPTGSFGPLTQAAVRAYQEANGITPATGYVGPLTRAKLNEGNPNAALLAQLLAQLLDLQNKLKAALGQ